MRPRSFGPLSAGIAIVFALVLAGPVAPRPAAAGEGRPGAFHDARLDALTGHWQVRREIRGAVLANTLDAEWVLDHRFLRLHYRDVARPMQYEAEVYLGWDEQRAACVAHWIDVFGGRFSETLGYGTWTGDSLTLVFDYPDGRFENCYRWYPGRGEWTSRSAGIDSTGARQPFASDVMTRATARRRPGGTR